MNTVDGNLISSGQTESKEAFETLTEIESRAIRKALEYTNGNVAKAALLLDIGRATLYRKIDKLDIKLNRTAQ